MAQLDQRSSNLRWDHRGQASAGHSLASPARTGRPLGSAGAAAQVQILMQPLRHRRPVLRLFALVASWGILGPSWRPKLLFGLEKKKNRQKVQGHRESVFEQD